jgi:ferredoxin-NADP reductase
VCGAPGLIEATRERCVSLGISPDRVRAEQYLPAPDTD